MYYKIIKYVKNMLQKHIFYMHAIIYLYIVKNFGWDTPPVFCLNYPQYALYIITYVWQQPGVNFWWYGSLNMTQPKTADYWISSFSPCYSQIIDYI